MRNSRAHIYLLLTLAATSTIAAGADSSTPAYGLLYKPHDNILLDCGAPSGSENDNDRRTWYSDVDSSYSPSLTSPGPTATSQDAPAVPYLTARIFTSPFTYSFPLGAGRKYLRLYFYSSNYTSEPSPTTQSLFSVTADDVTLLSNFSVAQTSAALNFAYLVQEYALNVSDAGLNITFTPSSSSAFAFVNGIEIVSIPDFFSTATPQLVTGGATPTNYQIDESTALQTVYRLNVGGQAVSPTDDSGLYRQWADDTPYIKGSASGESYSKDSNVSIQYSPKTPMYIAPVNVYSTARSMGPSKSVNLNYNLTWILSVDAGFYYLLRFHFCEIRYPFVTMGMRVFEIFVNNQTANGDVDVIQLAGGDGSIGDPVYLDFVTPAIGATGQIDLWVALHPNTRAQPFIDDAILNGLEVFKLQNNSSPSLAGPNPSLLPQADVEPDKVLPAHKRMKKTGPIAGGVIGAVLLGCLLLFVLCMRKKKTCKNADGASDGPSAWLPLSLLRDSHTPDSGKPNTGSNATSLATSLCRHFSFADIESATNKFDETLLLGVGGFGKVYRGDIDGGSLKVAIKRGDPLSRQGINEFQTEIEMLSKLRHKHLVSLIGYCEEKNEMILVYDYMAYGTLREHLYKTQNPPLSWKKRLEICIGAARGLHYLHTGAKYVIIHRDVKTTNILLDGKWVAKVSDFGLSKTGPELDNTHVSTIVKGSFGYLDPEYLRRQQLTEKSDVYSFGVVLFEVLCARPALNPTLAKEQVNLADWALHCQRKGVLDSIMDPFLKDRIAPECFKKFAETAEKCVADNGIERPAMGDVLWNLEFALQLQESAEEKGMLGGGMSDGHGETLSIMIGGKKERHDPTTDSKSSGTTTTTTTMSSGGQSLVSEDSDRLTPSAVFSQIMNPNGR